MRDIVKCELNIMQIEIQIKDLMTDILLNKQVVPISNKEQSDNPMLNTDDGALSMTYANKTKQKEKPKMCNNSEIIIKPKNKVNSEVTESVVKNLYQESWN